MDGIRKYILKDDEIEQSLHELDETVASVGDCSAYVTPKRRATEESSVGSYISSQSHAVLMHRYLVDNKDTTKKGFPRISSSCSRKSVSSRRSRRSTSRSISSRSSARRGPSLERVISQTILQAAGSEQADAHFLVESDVPTASPDDILKDLIQADAVLAAEGGHTLNLLPPIETEDEPELLPSIETEIGLPETEEWRPSFEAVQFPAESPKATCPSDRASNEIPDPATLETSSKIVETDFEKVYVSGETTEKTFIIYETDPENPFGDDPFGELNFGEAQHQFSALESIESNEIDWMSFGGNPFQNDNVSPDSPSSIADFAKVVDWIPTRADSWHDMKTKFSF